MRHWRSEGFFQYSIAAQILKVEEKGKGSSRECLLSERRRKRYRLGIFPAQLTDFGAEASFQAWDGSCTLTPFTLRAQRSDLRRGIYSSAPGIHVPEASPDFLATRFGEWLH